MAAEGTAFAFDENASLSDNLSIFGVYVKELDAALGPEMRGRLLALVDGNYKHEEIWDRLFEICNTSPAVTDDDATDRQAAVPTANVPATAQPAVAQSPTVTGWLLEGVLIEGFRGVNNEDRPLELKFKPAKVNSVSAVNGVGKTSVYDAVRYAITGKLPWLDELPAVERDRDYYQNRFHSTGQATIKLRLVAEPGAEKCEITVVRSPTGLRTVSATAPWDANAILTALNREFVLLDGPTFQKFITAPPLARGRTFSGLLGLSAYSDLRQALAGLANTRAFNNHFDITAHAQTKIREERTGAELSAAIAKDYELLVGTPLGQLDTAAAKDKCHEALVQITPLKPQCEDKAYDAIDIDVCIDAIKDAEGGPKRERLGACIRERENIAKMNHEAPTRERAPQLATRAAERESALAKTSGHLMLELYQAGTKVVERAEWEDSYLCPLCDGKGTHSLRDHLAAKLSEFEILDQTTTALAAEWNEAGWTELLQLEAELEPVPEKRLLAAHQTRAGVGAISKADADALVQWLDTLRTRAEGLSGTLAAEQTQLEKELPPSSVEVTKKVETARRLQENWRKLEQSRKVLADATARDACVDRIRTFLGRASKAFATAEAGMSEARLTAVEPVFKDYFKKMSFHGVEPTVSKKAGSEELRIGLAQFYGLTNVSPQALLSESFRNAFAISLYLAAASLYGGLPKFVVLDDVTSSFDAGHQHFLVELIRTTFARPGKASGPQVILLSHDTMLEKLFNKHSNSGTWWHQRLEGSPQIAVLPQAGAVNKVRDLTISMLQAGQVDFAKEGVRQYLEYRLSDLISKLRIPVPVDIAFNDDKQLSSEFLKAIEAAVKLHKAANCLVLDAAQEAGLNTNMVTIVSNFLSHWGTGQTAAFSASSLLGVMQAIADYCNCFTFEPTPGAPRVYYKSLSQRQ
ncbi:AAA family ATPase [Acidiphilium sp. C61]|uniref:AAA family ATPase n=1 Tax=Acidiphilium sp. C61 TaxID=1671485 RepID=UPI00157BB1D9|nr:AAA family ATPase [Acidiphilium sp. C61]